MVLLGVEGLIKVLRHRSIERYNHALPKKPSYMLTRTGAFERIYVVDLYAEKPEEIFELRPQIEVFNRWDKERLGKHP